MITDVFNRMVAYVLFCCDEFSVSLTETTRLMSEICSSCHSKCINQRYAEGDLNKGESVCIDRCVAKYIEVNKVIGEKMRAAGQQQGGF